MTNKELVLSTMRKYGKAMATDLQDRAPQMTGTEIHAEEEFIPMFNQDTQYLNKKAGYICRSFEGNVVKLLQPYDSTVHSQVPEFLPALWGFYWSTDPKKAKPFLKSAESPYNKDDCCTYEGRVWRSTLATANVYSPSEYPQGWEDLGPVEDFQ